ncbi:MAG: 6-hydroxymethylpterin diphosphokinase MptE-like protein [Thermodesulfobacteriota bacterium]
MEAFSPELYRHNLDVLSMVSPEVASWLQAGCHCAPPPAEKVDPAEQQPLASLSPRPGGITLVVGGGLLDQVAQLLTAMPAGHQVFCLQPRAELLAAALGRHDLSDSLEREELVLLAPGEAALEEALSRNPQLGLSGQMELVRLHQDNNQEAAAAGARLYRVLGHALRARDLALDWEMQSGGNLVANLIHAAFQAGAVNLPGSLAGRPAVLAGGGPSLQPALELLAGHLGGAAFFCCDKALPAVAAAGIIPSGVGLTSPELGPLFAYSHPVLEQTPLIAEEVAHAPTVRAHPGPIFLCLGPRGTAQGPLASLADSFSPQQHTLTRLAELALAAGCHPLILVGTDMLDPEGSLMMPDMNGGLVPASLYQAAGACALGRVLARYGAGAVNTSLRGLGLPGTRYGELAEQLPRLGGPGQPLQVPALAQERWLDAEGLEAYALGLNRASTSATRLWQRAAAPLADYQELCDQRGRDWLFAAEALFLALAEQAAADSMLAAFLDGCLVRSFRRRHHLVCQSRSRQIGVQQCCDQLRQCLQEMEGRAGELAQGLRRTAEEFRDLARARREGDRAALDKFARSAGHSPAKLQ